MLIEISVWQKGEVEKCLLEQHENTQKHKNHGRKSGQTAVTKYTARNFGVELSNISISVRMQGAWWLAKEDVAIYKFDSWVRSNLLTHGYFLNH